MRENQSESAGCAESDKARVVREFNQLCIEDTRKRDMANSANCVSRSNPRQLIEDRINYHNSQSRHLCALLRALPQEMSSEAEDALATFIISARPSW